MPAFNAEQTLQATVESLPEGSVDEIIVVDDASSDGTVAVAERLGLRVFRHPENLGYGANQKSCYRAALAAGAEIVVMVHPDFQYDPRLVPFLVGLIEQGVCDVMLGNRVRTRHEALAGGMPVYKYFGNRLLTIVENIVLGQNLGEFHSGFRAYSREVLETVPWEQNSDDFVFDQQFLMEAVWFGFRIGDVPVPTRYFDEASSIGLSSSLRYASGTLFFLGAYLLARCGLRSRWFPGGGAAARERRG